MIYDVVYDIFEFCIINNLRIKASHLSGHLNTHADELSRRSRDHSYSLPPHLFSLICDIISFSPCVDLFASRLNYKLPDYYSAGPDPYAIDFDSLHCSWPDQVYAFPPIHLVDRFINRFLFLDIKYGLLICPFWPSQPYFSVLLDLLIDDPIILSASDLLDADLLPKSLSHLLACSISSDSVLQRAFHRKLRRACCAPSIRRRSVHICEDGVCSQVGVVNSTYAIAHSL